MRELMNRLSRDLILSGILYIGFFLRSLLFLPMISKTLGTEGYGAWAVVMATISLLLPFITLNLDYSFTRFLPSIKKSSNLVRDHFYSTLGFILLLSLAWCFLLLLFDEQLAMLLFDDIRLTPLIIALVSLLPAESIISSCLNYYRAFRRMTTYVFLSFAQILLEIFLVFAAVSYYHNVIAAIQAVLLVRWFMASLQLFLVVREQGITLPTGKNLKKYLLFGVPLLPGNLSSWAVRSIDRYFIVFFLSLSAVGIYSAAYGLVGTLTIFVAPFSLILPSLLAELHDNNAILQRNLVIFYSYKYLILLMIPVAVGMTILGDDLLLLFTNPEFVSQGASIIGIIALSMLFYGLYVIFSQLIIVSKNTKVIPIVWMIGATSNIILNAIFIPSLGLWGAAIATLVSYAEVTMIVLFMITKKVNFTKSYLIILVKVVLATMTMAFIVFLIKKLLLDIIFFTIKPPFFLVILFTVTIGFVTYVVMTFVLQCYNQQELSLFRDFLCSFISRTKNSAMGTKK